ncbi:hypothetical protein [Streptomyces anulatus]|uniref:hypothetical protein n=1 Tax=Streptomyces anulatus TaxID=1892 RepID=UPI0037177129
MVAAQAGKYATPIGDGHTVSHVMDLATGFEAALTVPGVGGEVEAPVGVLTAYAMSVNVTGRRHWQVGRLGSR